MASDSETLIKRINRWRDEWAQIVMDAESLPDKRIAAILKNWQPDFQSLQNIDGGNIAAAQSEFWQADQPSSVLKTAERVKRHIAVLTLPDISRTAKRAG